MIRIFLAAGALALLAIAPTGAYAQKSAGALEAAAAEEQDSVVARVGGRVLRQSDVVRAYSRLPAQLQQVPISVLYTQILQQLVDGELLAEAGRDEKLQDSEDVKQQVAEFEKVAVQRAYMDQIVDKELSDEKIRESYNNTIVKTEGPLQVRASHILVESEEEAKEILKALEKDGDFAKLARERSTGPSGPRGGDLGYFARSQMVEPFSDAAFALEPGTVGPDPVKTEFGWHVIKVVDKRRQPPPSFEESRAGIEEQLTRDIIAAHMTKLRADAKIEMFNFDGSPIEDAPKK
ncbi:MAG: peptidylprolyl isomerase [Alphaproteobacteria bacterium]